MADSSREEEIKKGLEGIIAGNSMVCMLDGQNGKLEYRGYNIKDLAGNCTFEEVAYLLLYGKLPSKAELKAFKKVLAERRKLPKHVIKTLKSLPTTMNSMEAMRTLVSALGAGVEDPRKLNAEQLRDQAVTLTATFPVISAYFYRMKRGLPIVKPSKKLGHAANYLYMLKGTEPSEEEAKAIDMDLVLHAEHSFNASTFAVRVTISTLSDIYSAMVTGIGVLKGPLHGGAASQVMGMLEKIGDVGNVDSYINNALANKQKIMGIGHRVYRTYDPRAVILKEEARKFSENKGDMKWFRMAEKIEEKMMQEKGLYANVDFYSAIVYHNLGMPPEMDSDIFAVSRVTGWAAHALEQYSDNRLIRPLDNYIGPVDLQFVPLDKRK